MTDGSTAPADPLVSVIVPAFEAGGFIARAIDSALAQTVGAIEIVVVDDASRDGTAATIEGRYPGERRLIVLRQPENRGPAAARNRAMGAARGAWLAPLDADDAWRPERLERMLRRAEATGADLVLDNLTGYDAEAGAETGPLFSAFPDGPGLDVPALLAPRQPGSAYDFGYLKPLVRRAFVAERGLAYDEDLRTSEDLLFALALLMAGARSATLADALYLYTTPVSGTSGRPSAMTNTVPRDDQVRRALEAVLARAGRGLPAADAAAIQARIDHLRAVGPLSRFYHARTHRNWPGMAALLLREPAVRRDVGRKVVRRLLGPRA